MMTSWLAPGFSRGRKSFDVPLPGGLAGALAISIFATTYRIIDNPEISAAPGDRTANTSSIVLTAHLGLPLTDRFPVGSDTDGEDGTVRLRGDEIADPSPESFGKLSVCEAAITEPSGWRPRYHAGKSWLA